MSELIESWIESANDPQCPFPVNNLPFGVFSVGDGQPRCGIAIGDSILDVAALEADGHLDYQGCLSAGQWNALMAAGPEHWARLRLELQTLLRAGATSADKIASYLVARQSARLYLPFEVSEYTDFYASKHHATNVGTMFRGAENALPPNWLHIPIGYNGRASSVVISGSRVTRPWGQIKLPADGSPIFAKSRKFDIELELGAIVGTPSNGPISVRQADRAIFGYVLLNDWSARDIQAWEYQPLGPFQSKATATTISPWIVSALALEPFRVPTPSRDVPLLAYLDDTLPTLYDIALEVSLTPDGGTENRISSTNYREMYFSSAQQLAHHTTCGCPMRTGDLLGSGTISGPLRENRGSLLELAWGGQDPITLSSGQTRTFLEDGDTVILRGEARGNGYRIGFGECTGTIDPSPERLND